jgi:hypothetical protein
MFRNLPAADPPPEPVVVAPPPELIPLSVLELDLASPVEGWAAHLAARGISITIDDIGRGSVSRSDARQLFDEKREAEARAREHAAVVERQAIEQDQRFRASLGVGLPAAALQGFETYGQAIASHELDGQQYRPRTTLIADVLDNSADTLIFHSLTDGDAW